LKIYVNSPERACFAVGARACGFRSPIWSGSTWRWVPTVTNRLFYPWKGTPFPVGRPHSRPDISKKIKISCSCRDYNPESCSP